MTLTMPPFLLARGTESFYPLGRKLGFSLWAIAKVKRVTGISHFAKIDI